jgi:uncharacterized protein YgiM (DUF1202 family)
MLDDWETSQKVALGFIVGAVGLVAYGVIRNKTTWLGASDDGKALPAPGPGQVPPLNPSLGVPIVPSLQGGVPVLPQAGDKPTWKVSTVTDPLNVRSAPTTLSPIVGTLPKDSFATGTGTLANGWVQISSPLQGWVSNQYVTLVPQAPSSDTSQAPLSGGGNSGVTQVSTSNSSAP